MILTMRCSIVLIILLLLSAFAPASRVHALVQQPPDIPSFLGYAPDKIVVKFEQNISERIGRHLAPSGRFGIPALDRLAEQYDVTSVVQAFPGARTKVYRGREVDLTGWRKIYFRKSVDVQAAADMFKKIKGVVDAQVIGIHAVYRTPNDPFFYNPSASIIQWHLDQAADHDIDAPEAWENETGREAVIAAVVDTGVRYGHKDLGGAAASPDNPAGVWGNMWINAAERNGQASVDDDGNGLVDDWIGWDFVESAGSLCWSGEDCSVADNDPRDFNGHGTHVAGIVAALNNNGYAVASTAGGWGNGTLQAAGNGVKIMALRIGWSYRYLGSEFGVVSMDYAAEALRYAADNGARLVNASWGTTNSGGLADAIDYFLAAGGLIFHAAGNNYADFPDYMDQREDVIKVAATDDLDCKADFSNFGSWVDVSAPGVGIWSTYHVHSDAAVDYVASLSGTSMASPLALSVAALIWSQHPFWSADQVKQQLLDTADDVDSLSCNAGYAGKLGAGRVNAFNAVELTCRADIEGDGDVDGADLAGLSAEFGRTDCGPSPPCGADFDHDNDVDVADLAVLVPDFGRSDCRP
jgi:subtilisin family serine protease